MSINTVEYANQLLAENADLKKQVEALAAEVQSVREQSEEVYAAGYNHGHLNTVDGIAYAPGTEGDFYSNALQVMVEADTPATDAAIREIGAKAVEAASLHIEELAETSGIQGFVSAARLVQIYANSIRAGEV